MTGTTDKPGSRAARPRPTTGIVGSRPPAEARSALDRRGAAGAEARSEASARRQLRTDQLLSAVENELIPRLLVTHATDVGPVRGDAPAAGPWAAPDEIRRFAELCVEDTSDLLNRHVSKLLSRDVTLEAVYLYLIAPAARHLGDAWSADELSFVDVQLGLCRLHQLVCECDSIGERRDGEADAFSILLSAVPGDQHTFGVTLAADFFRRRGWRVSNLAGLERDHLLERVATTSYSAVGFSLHSDGFARALPALVRRVREISANPDVLVLVGGDYFARHPRAAEEAGADLAAEDAHRAVALAEARLRAAAGRAR